MLIDPIYMDNHLLVVSKPAGMLVQGDKSGDVSLLRVCKKYIKERFNKPSDVYLGLVHRLDRPTSGVILFARTSKAAARLSNQFREHNVQKKYYALLEGQAPLYGALIDYLYRKDKTTVVSNDGNGKVAKLNFKRLYAGTDFSLVDIQIVTGRHHQIRVQFSHRKLPIVGDIKYGGSAPFKGRNIALQAYSLSIFHPITDERMTFHLPMDESWQTYLEKS